METTEEAIKCLWKAIDYIERESSDNLDYVYGVCPDFDTLTQAMVKIKDELNENRTKENRLY
jgi:hypothetical protein